MCNHHGATNYRSLIAFLTAPCTMITLNLSAQQNPSAFPMESLGNTSRDDHAQVCPQGQTVTPRRPLARAKLQQGKQSDSVTNPTPDNVISRLLKAS